MCGIFGYYGIPQIEEKFDQELDLLTHRGPDNKSSFNSYLNDKLLFLSTLFTAFISLES